MTKIKRPKIERAIDELWLPPSFQRKPSQPPSCKRFMGHYPCSDCCGTSGDCDICTCENCSGTTNPATCCWKVVIAGIADLGTADCTDCATLNKTYFLSDFERPGPSFGTAGVTNDCYWEEEAVCGDCDPSRIILEVVFESPDYIIRVTMDGHIWEKNYGETRPDCCNLTNETIPHVTSAGDCDSSSTTCVISATSDGNTCDTAPCLGDCSNCNDPPEEVAVDLGDFGLSNDACDGCTTVTGVFAAIQVGTCAWTFCADSWCTANQCQNSNPGNSVYFLAVTAEITGTTTLQWRVTIQLSGGGTCSGAGAFWGLRWLYRSDSWLFADGPNCFFLADENGKVSLSRSFGDSFNTCPGNGKTPLCGNEDSVPETIHIFDANA